ncbi:MAG: helix-turn-helix transcriptional regulator [Pseudomonadota bacterium]
MKRLYEAAEALRGITGQSDVARAMNASPQTINNWEARGMSKAGMLNAQSAFGCSATWLETGEGAMALGQTSAMMPVRMAENNDPDFVLIPMVKLRLQAGVTGFQTEPERRDGGTLGMRRSWIERTGLDPARLVAVQVRGASMEPALYESDIVVINTADQRLVDGEVYAFNYEGEAVVKRLSRDAGDWWLTSDNPDQRKYHRKICRGEACIVIGRVVRKESDRI